MMQCNLLESPAANFSYQILYTSCLELVLQSFVNQLLLSNNSS